MAALYGHVIDVKQALYKQWHSGGVAAVVVVDSGL